MKFQLQLIDSPTERSTSATDVLLAIQGGIWIGLIYGWGQADGWKALIWMIAFGLLTVASLIGAVAHGLKLSETVQGYLWRLLYLLLGLMVGAFLVGVTNDVWGRVTAEIAAPFVIIAALGFYGVTWRFPQTFLLFIFYELLGLLIALVGYSWLLWQGELMGAWAMVVGILLTLVAAIVQTRQSWQLTLIWSFDHNGLFHLIQLVANGFILWGLYLGFMVP